ncbi:LOW QUALITY PROTEIN: putative disease resistance protein RGA1 [Durio zibethinus]|uniref:LOW QUALITY PROTEIN: putative disease resistance protein RGA1 n=1 Tax=Durio zibethinus TaxID=66656 RepID=A0A6P5XFG6_DURZI|nr:LOW QUALITY PROTEIN: putative disease resistance protein RGA1 [Durio zibethinus]
MAEPVLFNIADRILGKLGNLAVQEMGLAWGVKEELEKLKNTVSTIKAVLLDAEEQHAKSHEVRDWLGKLKDAVYDADDLLDDFSTHVLQRQVMMMPGKRGIKQVSFLFSKANQVAYNLKIGHQIKAIREKLDAIAADKTKYHFTDQSPIIMPIVKVERKQTHSFVRKEDLVGREGDKEAIMKRLLDSDVVENVSVIPIVGIGGQGKTTLAQIVYNDEKIVKHFELRIWVCVSDVFDVKLIVQKILESATNAKCEYFEMDSLQTHLRKGIDGRKYLLILDDVWNDNRERWRNLRDLLMNGTRGSKIVVTTRAQVVAAITGTTEPYLLDGLPEDTSWSLFEKMAFKEGQEPNNSRLVAIGKDIVRRCAGNPLAIRTIGGVLYTKDTETEWLSLKEGQLLMVSSKEDGVLSILKLSYEQLPPYLKQCFAYCSLFPKDYEINKQMLISLWIAEGFIQSFQGIQCPEELGDQYFMDLLRRSFFQDVEYDEWGNVISCKMHDLMHDLAQLVAGSDSSIVDLDCKNISDRIRHVSFNAELDSSWKIPTPLLKADKIRTFLLPVQPIHRVILDKVDHDAVISSFKLLRVLDLHNTGLGILSSSISKLKHLRYLDLSKNEVIKRIPSSMTELLNLQTLKLYSCKRLEELPRKLRNMTSLRHLETGQCTGLTHMPSGIGQLTSLQTLTRFIVGVDSFEKTSGGLRELKDLNDLRGELMIAKLENLKNVASECKEANLKEKQYLEVLTLEWSREVNNHIIFEEDEALLEGLQPHSNLQEFHVYGYRAERFPNWMLFNMSLLLPNLLEITIWSCNRCIHLPLLSHLPKLKVLRLEVITAVEYIEDSGAESSSSLSFGGNLLKGGTEGKEFFPCLKELMLFDLRNLKGWWREDSAVADDNCGKAAASPQRPLEQKEPMPSFPCLSKLSIGICTNLTYMPLHPHLEELQLKNVSAKLLQQSDMIAAGTEEIPIAAAAANFLKVKVMHIDGIIDLLSFPDKRLHHLTSLQHLSIDNCPKLVCLPEEGLKSLASLRFFYIRGCEMLKSLSKGFRHLKALEELEIKECRELDLSKDVEENAMELHCLKSLRTLKIGDMPQLSSLPDGLQHITTLKYIQISSCSNLKILPEWICNLTSIQRFEVFDCPQLASFPQTLCSVKSLQYLEISSCPQLLDTCQNKTSKNWSMIAHIPEIFIDGKKM